METKGRRLASMKSKVEDLTGFLRAEAMDLEEKADQLPARQHRLAQDLRATARRFNIHADLLTVELAKGDGRSLGLALACTGYLLTLVMNVGSGVGQGIGQEAWMSRHEVATTCVVDLQQMLDDAQRHEQQLDGSIAPSGGLNVEPIPGNRTVAQAGAAEAIANAQPPDTTSLPATDDTGSDYAPRPSVADFAQTYREARDLASDQVVSVPTIRASAQVFGPEAPARLSPEVSQQLQSSGPAEITVEPGPSQVVQAQVADLKLEGVPGKVSNGPTPGTVAAIDATVAWTEEDDGAVLPPATVYGSEDPADFDIDSEAGQRRVAAAAAEANLELESHDRRFPE